MSNPNDQEWPEWIVECTRCPPGHYYNSDDPEDTDSIISLDFDVCLDPPTHLFMDYNRGKDRKELLKYMIAMEMRETPTKKEDD